MAGSRSCGELRLRHEAAGEGGGDQALWVASARRRRRGQPLQLPEDEQAAYVREPAAERGGLGEKAVVVAAEGEAVVGDGREPARELPVLRDEPVRLCTQALHEPLFPSSGSPGGLAVGDHAAAAPLLRRRRRPLGVLLRWAEARTAVGGRWMSGGDGLRRRHRHGGEREREGGCGREGEREGRRRRGPAFNEKTVGRRRAPSHCHSYL